MVDLRVTPVPGGVLIEVRLRPRASRSGVDGVREGALALRVNAPPVDGAANAAARELLADVLDVARARVALHAGEKSRRKVFRVEGLDAAAVVSRISAVINTS